MRSSSPSARRTSWHGLALLGLLTLAGTAASAQTLPYTIPLVQNVAGTYTDLGTTGTVISTSSTDDANSAPQSIGFGFTFNGQSFTQFVLNTNGFLKLGPNAPSSASLFTLENQPTQGGPINSINAADANLLVPFNFDLEAGTSLAEYRVVTTGTSPDRVCTIQWKNVSDKAGTTGKQYTNFSFQVKLYETTNIIEFVYGPSTGSTGPATANPHWATTGIKGTNALQGQVITAVKASVNPWSSATFQDVPYDGTTNALNFRSTVLTDAGRTFRFTPQFANDIEVQLVYTATKLPLAGAGSQVVQAVLRNVGTATQANIPVRLAVTGATVASSNQSITSLAPGVSTTVTFAGYTPTALGTNNVTVSLLGDDNASNNSKTVTQLVNNTIYRYDNGTAGGFVFGVPTSPAGVGANVLKFNTTTARTVTGMNVNLASAGASATVSTTEGRTVYAVVLNAARVVVGRSADYVVTAADVASGAPAKSFTLNTPAPVGPGEYYVGLASVTPAGSLRFYPLLLDNEIPTRTGTSYSIASLDPTAPNTVADVASGNPGLPMIEAVLNTTTGTSKALEAAVSVYPNPSNGEFTLQVRGAKAVNGLQVEVNNLLGQRVYAGAAKDNFENKLNLSHLSAGLYTLKVLDGDQYMTRSISITK